jgi:tetratricopeptide (TPR) repeat protein
MLYRALSKDPAFRGSNAGEMLTALESVRSILATADAQTTPKHLIQIQRRAPPELKQSIEHASKPRWATSSQPHPRRRWLLAGILAILAAACIFLLLVRPRGPYRVAVLPFENVGNHSENEVVVQGLMDSFAGKLSNLNVDNRPLWVVPASEVRRRKITDPAAARKQLGATYVVKGSVERDGQDVHLNVNLIDAKNLRQIGSADLEDPAGDLGKLQNEAVSRIASVLSLSVPAGKTPDNRAPANAAAYEDYLKAVGYMERYDKPGHLDLAITALKNAVHTDPNFALGYAQLGDAYRLKYMLDRNADWLEQAQAYCQKAVELDNRMPAVYVTLGYLHEATARHDLALHEFQRALDLDSTNAAALSGLASAYEHSGRIPDAEAAFQKAVALRPDDWDGYNRLGNFYDRHARYGEALAALRRAIELTPDNAQAYFNLGAVYLDIGDTKSLSLAEQALKKSIELSPSYPAYANLGNLYSRQQRYAETAAATEKALQLNDRDYLVWDNLVAAYEWLHNPAKAGAARQRMLPLIEQAVALKPQDAMAQSMLAKIYAQDQAPDKALARVKTSLALAPDDPNVLSNVSETYELMHDRRHALEYLEKALHNGLAMSQVRAYPDLQELLKDPHFHAAHP